MLNDEFHFSLDVCATEETAKCRRYFTKEDDALSMEWSGVCWMNPPYGRKIGVWLKKAYESTISNDATVVCLIPARTDTAWWHDYVMKANEIRFIRGRLKFGDAKNSAPFPSAIVVFQPFSPPMGFEVKTQERVKMDCNHPHTQTIADCWTEERNDAGINCYGCEKCGMLLEKHPSCDVHYDS
jgi:phage N-6-adenine-methyltransferase